MLGFAVALVLGATLLVAGCGEVELPAVGPRIDIPTGADPEMSPKEIELTIRYISHRNELELDGALADFRILSMTLLLPGETYEVAGEGDNGRSLTFDQQVWVVEAEGTFKGRRGVGGRAVFTFQDQTRQMAVDVLE